MRHVNCDCYSYNSKKRSWNDMEGCLDENFNSVSPKRKRRLSLVHDSSSHERLSREPNKVSLNKKRRHRSDSPSPVRRIGSVDTLRIERMTVSGELKKTKANSHVLDVSTSKHLFGITDGKEGAKRFLGIQSNHIKNRVSESVMNYTGPGTKENQKTDDEDEEEKNLAAVNVLMNRVRLLLRGREWTRSD